MVASVSDSAFDLLAGVSRSHFNCFLGRLTEIWTHLCSILNVVEMPEVIRYNLEEINSKTKGLKNVGGDLS